MKHLHDQVCSLPSSVSIMLSAAGFAEYIQMDAKLSLRNVPSFFLLMDTHMRALHACTHTDTHTYKPN